jgi:hypothetical protein
MAAGQWMSESADKPTRNVTAVVGKRRYYAGDGCNGCQGSRGQDRHEIGGAPPRLRIISAHH